MSMCANKILKHSNCGYVMLCKCCNNIQVAYGTTIVSMTQKEFHEYVNIIDELYNIHNLYGFKDEKTIKIPTAAQGVAMIYSVNELKELLQLLADGKNRMEYELLFELCEN